MMAMSLTSRALRILNFSSSVMLRKSGIVFPLAERYSAGFGSALSASFCSRSCFRIQALAALADRLEIFEEDLWCRHNAVPATSVIEGPPAPNTLTRVHTHCAPPARFIGRATAAPCVTPGLPLRPLCFVCALRDLDSPTARHGRRAEPAHVARSPSAFNDGPDSSARRIRWMTTGSSIVAISCIRPAQRVETIDPASERL